MVFKSDVSKEKIDEAVKLVEDAGGHIQHKYHQAPTPVLHGFAGTIPDSALSTSIFFFIGFVRYISFAFLFINLVEKVRELPGLNYVEADGQVSAFAKSVGI